MFILTAIKSIDFVLLEGDRLVSNRVTQFVNIKSKTHKWDK